MFTYAFICLFVDLFIFVTSSRAIILLKAH